MSSAVRSRAKSQVWRHFHPARPDQPLTPMSDSIENLRAAWDHDPKVVRVVERMIATREHVLVFIDVGDMTEAEAHRYYQRVVCLYQQGATVEYPHRGAIFIKPAQERRHGH